MEKKLREDLWKAIQAHYERKDYTEAIRDALFHTCELLRDKTGMYDKDSTKLVESTLLGNNPSLLINKFETTTEKDVQHGIGFILKGIMMSVRNPLSHEKCSYTKEDAEVIISYVNYLLNQIDRSGGVTKIDNIMELLYDEDFTDTAEYAELLLKEIPVKKRYDLLLTLYNNRTELPLDVLQNFISYLFNLLTKAEKKDFINIVSSSLLRCKNDDNLKLYAHYFMSFTYKELDRLAQLRIEDLVLKSVRNGQLEVRAPNYLGGSLVCNESGTLSTWFVNKLNFLSNKQKIIDELFSKIGLFMETPFVFKNFGDVLYAERESYSKEQIEEIQNYLKALDTDVYEWLKPYIEISKDETMIKLFGKDFEKCKQDIKKEKTSFDGLPF